MRRCWLMLVILFPMLVGAGPATRQASSRPTTRASYSRIPQSQAPPPQVQAHSAKYLAATTQQAAKAIVDAQAFAADVSKQVNVSFKEIQTDHFIIFTDWDPREYGFLKTNLEGAYGLVSRTFDMSPRDNVFIGKLPVFMYAKKSDFVNHATQIDGLPAQVDAAGYYAHHRQGTGHMVMWKPVADAKVSLDQAKLRWARVLTHEFVHAFVARYRNNNDNIPVWLNEGTAELVADGEFYNSEGRKWARYHAVNTPDVTDLFDSSSIKTFDMYPVMQAMVECLVKQDRKAFIAMFDAIKDGTAPEQALKQWYGIDYKGLDQAWRRYAMSK
jgi:hypothetical protein